MKKLDILMVSLFIIIDVVLLLLPGCPLDIYAFFLWLAVIAIFVICMHYLRRKKERRRQSLNALPE